MCGKVHFANLVTTGLQLKSYCKRMQSKLFSGIIEVHDLEIFLVTTYVGVIIPTGILNYKQAHSLGSYLTVQSKTNHLSTLKSISW